MEQFSTVPKQKLEIASTPEDMSASGANQLHLQAQLWLEQCLNQLQRRLNQWVLQTITAQSQTEIFQIVVEELSAALETDCALTLVDTTISECSLGLSTNQIRYVAATKQVHPSTTNVPTVGLATGNLLCLQIGQIISIEELLQLQNQQPQSAWQLLDEQGVLGWLITAASPLFDGEPGEVLKAQYQPQLIERSLEAVAIALTQIREIQTVSLQRQQLEAVNQELVRTNKLKSEFLANTSHEIRTPLSSILGFTHLLLAQGYNPDNLRHQEYLNIILNSGQHLLALINDILDLSKIEANQLEVQPEPVNLPELCRNVLALVKEKANDKGLQLRLDLDPYATTLVADSLRLKQMLFNLLSNALKFTVQGTVGLQVKHKGVFIHFTVWDTGTGISQEEQAILFQPYRQIANVVAGREQGTGLGLALTKKLAELHGGSIQLQSELGRGSQFTIVLPLTAAAKGKFNPQPSHLNPQPLSPNPQAPITLQPTPILLVEDNFHNAKLMATYLRKLGYQIIWVQDAAQMWQSLAQLQPGLILMDIQLPDVDGLTLIQQLQAHEQYQTIPVIAQTAMAMKGDRETCIAAGAIAYISKPIDLKILANLVSKYSIQKQ